MEFIVGAVLWILANWVYVDMRRRGERGFKRLVAFLIGWPGTLVGLLSVEDSSQPPIRTDDRDLRSLVQEIRRDRGARAASPGARPARLSDGGGDGGEAAAVDESGGPQEEER